MLRPSMIVHIRRGFYLRSESVTIVQKHDRAKKTGIAIWSIEGNSWRGWGWKGYRTIVNWFDFGCSHGYTIEAELAHLFIPKYSGYSPRLLVKWHYAIDGNYFRLAIPTEATGCMAVQQFTIPKSQCSYVAGVAKFQKWWLWPFVQCWCGETGKSNKSMGFSDMLEVSGERAKQVAGRFMLCIVI